VHPPAARGKPPANALEALERASFHARQAGVELVAAARAVLDAASIGFSGQPSDANSALSALTQGLDELQARLGDGSTSLPAPIAAALLEALDAEIQRWEQQSAGDPAARPVLRTFLGVREILWEFGVRRPDADAGARAPEPRDEGVGTTRGGARRTQKAADVSAGTRSKKRPKPANEPHARRVKRIDVKG